MKRNIIDCCKICKHANEYPLSECMDKCNELYLALKLVEKEKKDEDNSINRKQHDEKD